MRTFFLAILTSLLLSAHLLAQTHDLELRIDVNAPAVTPPGTTGTLTFTVTNHGPDAAGLVGPPGTFRILVAAGLETYSLVYGELIDFNQIADPSLCALSANLGDPLPGDPIPVIYTLRFENLLPGESKTCDVEFIISPFAHQIDPVETSDGNILHRWTLSSPPGTDPDPSNNRIYVTYQLVPPSTIPTLNPWGLAALSLGLVAAYAFVRRRP